MTDPLFQNYESIPTDDGDYRYCWSKGHIDLDSFADKVAREECIDWYPQGEYEAYGDNDNPTQELLGAIKAKIKYRWAIITDDFWRFAEKGDQDAIPVTVFIY